MALSRFVKALPLAAGILTFPIGLPIIGAVIAPKTTRRVAVAGALSAVLVATPAAVGVIGADIKSGDSPEKRIAVRTEMARITGRDIALRMFPPTSCEDMACLNKAAEFRSSAARISEDLGQKLAKALEAYKASPSTKLQAAEAREVVSERFPPAPKKAVKRSRAIRPQR